MDLFLFITGLVAMVIAIGLLLVSFFTRGSKKKLFILLGIGFIVLITGALIGGANMTPEEIAANEERKLARAEKKEAKLEAERLEKEELEKEEKAEIERKKDEQERIKELEKQTEIEESNQIEKEKLEKKEKELNEREQALKKREQKEQSNKNKEKEKTTIEPLVDIKDLAYKNEIEIKEILGEPHESESGSLPPNRGSVKYKTNYYDDGRYNVMFVNEKSTNIRISLTDEEYLDGNDIEKNVLYAGLPIKDMSIDVAPDGQMFANSYGFENIYRVEISRWRGSPGGFVFVILNEEYAF